MPFFKKIGEKRLWLGVLLTLILACAANAMGALLLCRGWLRPAYERMWMLMSWFLGSFIGCRYVLGDGRKKPLLWAGVTAGIVYAVIWIISLTFSHDAECVGNWWRILAALACGGLLSALTGSGKKSQKKKKKNGRTGTRRR